MASHTAPKSVKSRGSIKPAADGCTGRLEVHGPWEGCPAQLLAWPKHLICFSRCLLQLPAAQSAFSHGRFLLSLVLQHVSVELVTHSSRSKRSALSSPCAAGSDACRLHQPSPHHPLAQQWDKPWLQTGISLGFRPQGNRTTSMDAESHEMDKFKAMPCA